MFKSDAIKLLGGGEISAAAGMLGISYQAVDKWPDLLPSRISDRVLGACLRHGIDVPAALLDENQPPALTPQAQAATQTVAQAVA